MRFYVVFALAILFLAAAVVAAWRKSDMDRHGRLLTLSAGLFAALLVMIFPFWWDGSWPDVFLEAILSPVRALQIFSLNLDFAAEVKAFDTHEGFAWAYSYVLALLYLVAPLMLAGYALTYSRRAYAWFKWITSRGTDTWFFSEPSDKALQLAEDMLKHKDSYGKGVVAVFCGVDEARHERVTSIGAIAMSKGLDELRSSYFRKRYSSILFMGDSEETNMEETLVFIERLKREQQKNENQKDEQQKNENQTGENQKDKKQKDDKKDTKYLLYTFTSRPEADLLLNGKQDRDSNFICRIVRENLAIVYREIELTRLIEENAGDTHILVVGCGWIGMEMLKAILWSCTRQGHRLYLTAVDKQKVRERFEHDCPALSNEVTFIDNEDIDTFDISRLSDALEISHIYIALGNDEKNLACAIRMREAFRRAHKLNGESEPEGLAIHVELKDPLHQRIDFADRNKTPYRFTPIAYDPGKPASYYSYAVMLNPNLEVRALAEHFVYLLKQGEFTEDVIHDLAFDKKGTSYDWNKKGYSVWRKKLLKNNRIKLVESFYMEDYNAASSRAKAVYIERCEGDKVEYVPDDKQLNPNDRMKRGLAIEHERWKRYMMTLGYQYGFETDHMAKLHKDIVLFDQLSESEKPKDASYSPPQSRAGAETQKA